MSVELPRHRRDVKARYGTLEGRLSNCPWLDPTRGMLGYFQGDGNFHALIMFDKDDPAAVIEADRLSSFMVHKVSRSEDGTRFNSGALPMVREL